MVRFPLLLPRCHHGAVTVGREKTGHVDSGGVGGVAEDVPRVAAGGAEPGAAASPPPELGKAPGGGMFSIPHSVLPERPVLWPSRTVQGAEEGRGGWGGAASLLSVRGSRSRCGAAGTAPPADADPAATYRGRGGGTGRGVRRGPNGEAGGAPAPCASLPVAGGGRRGPGAQRQRGRGGERTMCGKGRAGPGGAGSACCGSCERRGVPVGAGRDLAPSSPAAGGAVLGRPVPR